MLYESNEGLTLFILGFLVQPGIGGGLNQPYGHKIVNNALWEMPFGTIIDIHKMYQKIQKILPDVISGAGAGAGKNGVAVNGTY